MGVLFETYLKHRGDVLMGRHHYAPLRSCHEIPIRRREEVPLRRLGDVPLRCRSVFHLRRTCQVAGTNREMSLRCCHILLPGGIICWISFRKFSDVIPAFACANVIVNLSNICLENNISSPFPFVVY